MVEQPKHRFRLLPDLPRANTLPSYHAMFMACGSVSRLYLEKRRRAAVRPLGEWFDGGKA